MSDDSTTRKPLFESFPKVPTEVWEDQIRNDLEGADYAKRLIWNTLEGFPIKPYYRKEDVPASVPHYGHPGSPPYVRGTHPTSQTWKMHHDIRCSSIEEAHQKAKMALDWGADSIGFQILFSYDQFFGIPVQNQTDMNHLLKDLPLDRTEVHLHGGNASFSILAMLLNAYKNLGAPFTKMHGSLDWDPITALIQPNHYIVSHERFTSQALNALPKKPVWESQMETQWTHLSQALSFVGESHACFQPITVQGRFYHNCGCTATQEVAYILATINEYLAHLTDRGHSAQQVSQALRCSVGVGSNYFMEIAKIRALRLLLNQVFQGYLSNQVLNQAIPIHAHTTHWNKAAYDTHTNILRTTTECMSAILGGCTTLSVYPFNDVHTDLDPQSERIARNISFILKYEACLDKVADPMGGSYYIEALTHEIAKNAWEQFQKIEAEGGMLEGIRNNRIQGEIQRMQSLRKERIASRKDTQIGINQYPNRLSSKTQTVAKKVEPVPAKQESSISLPISFPELMKTFQSGIYLMDTLPVYYTKNPSLSKESPTICSPSRSALELENIRRHMEQLFKGKPSPKVFMLCAGNLTMRIARATFAYNFFGCAGFDLIEGKAASLSQEDLSSAAQEAISHQPDIVVLCSADEEYPAIASEVCKTLKKALPNLLVIVAGFPKELMDTLIAQGVDDFIHVKSNLLEILSQYELFFSNRQRGNA